MDVTGIILAGGKSSRMGTDKGLLLVKGKPMVQYIIDALKKVSTKVIIISNNDEYKKFGLDVYHDLIKEKGPVGGVYTAMHYSDTQINFCISCDTPFVTSDLMMFLLNKSDGFDVVIPCFKGKSHPLIGVYKKRIKSTFKKNLINNQLKLRLVNEELKYNVIDINDSDFDELIFRNINTKDDLKNISYES